MRLFNRDRRHGAGGVDVDGEKHLTFSTRLAGTPRIAFVFVNDRNNDGKRLGALLGGIAGFFRVHGNC